MKWPYETRTAFQIVQAAGGDAVEVWGCLLTYTNRWTVIMISPFGALAVFMITYHILLYCRWKPYGREWSETGRESASHARLVIMRSFIGLLAFLYGPLCYHSLLILIAPDWNEQNRFPLDVTIEHGSLLHHFVAAFSLAASFFYGIGIPLFLIMMTNPRFWPKATPKQHESALGGLIECYKTEYW
jgi:hypothetical protein